MPSEQPASPFSPYAATLDRHGYGFQFAVLKAASGLRHNSVKGSRWQPRAAEFPVVNRGSATRIDLLLEHSQRPAYMIVECKRANPALANWCFVRAPYVGQGVSPDEAVVEVLKRFDDGVVRARSAVINESHHSHIALEVTTGSKGDAAGPGKGVIEEAVTQVLRGTAGFASFLHQNAQLLTPRADTFLLPVVCTTASLWLSHADLSTADMWTGKIQSKDADLEKVPWLLYQYHASPTLTHELPVLKDQGSDLPHLMQALYSRTVAIVSPDGLEDFLKDSSDIALKAAS